MMTRKQQYLIGLLIVQLILIVVVFWPRSAVAGKTGPLFAELAAAEVTAVKIADNSAQQIELQRQEGGWVVANHGDYPVDDTKLDPILEKLIGIQTNRLVAQTADSHERLQVADGSFVRRVALSTANGDSYTLYLGSTPSAGTTHVRLAGQDETYLATDLNVWEVSQNTANWIDTSYVTLDQESVTAVTLENGNGQFAFTRDGDGAWTFDDMQAGESFNQGNFNQILNRIASLRLSEPLGREALAGYGLSAPSARLSLTFTTAESTGSGTLLVGDKVLGSDQYVVKWSGSDFYVAVSSFTVENLISFTRSDFAAVPETEPTPAPAPGG